ncbi:MAG TPA: N-acetylmuramoyl-L-alanine amidase [Clostridia bacterium]|nr:N-acetylmuramoyl-L-alanine amidase [Clostridia bacterium]
MARRLATILALLALVSIPAFGKSMKRSKQLARTAFQNAERVREALNGQPANERSKREYQRAMDAYRRVYYTAPTSSKADSSVVAVAELLAEMGRGLNDESALRAAIGQYEFLRREYPGSKYRFDALFTIGQIYKEDLEENQKAKEAFQEFLRRYPRHRLAADARDAMAEMDAPKAKKEVKEKQVASEKKSALPLVTGIRHWSTPDYTRVAIDLEAEVKYEAGRVANPDRIFFDLHDTKLASVLIGKTFDVSDGFLRKIRVAQFQKGLTRIVLEVDDVSDYAVFMLPNPYRLIIDIHGRRPQKVMAKTVGPKQSASGDNTTEPAADKQPQTRTEAKSEPAKGSPTVGASGTPRPNAPAETARKSDTVVPQPGDRQASGTEKQNAKAEAQVREGALDENPETSTKTEVAKLSVPGTKDTKKPTTEPTFEAVAPRVAEKSPRIASKKGKKQTAAQIHQARPTANGERSLIRALGLKIGRIVVDAGHGGHDTGTIGPSGLLEKDLVLDVALRLGRLLQGRMGAEIIFTRDDDTFIPLETRTAVANQQQADLFISIHANSSSDATARGIETYYLNFTSSTDALEVAARENAVSEKSIHELQDLVKKIALKEKIEESREFAADVQKSLHAGLSAKTPAMRDRGVKKAPFIVLIGANMPSILAEISFLSNPLDERKLQTPEYRQKIADSLYKGVARYVSGLSGVKLASKAKEDFGQ